jgi:uncharacterized protein (DUF488 family)
MITLFTAGYEGRAINEFLDMLRAHGVAHLIDVRQLPISRKPDFGKRRLAGHLAAAGIGYSHIVELGTPKPLRDEVRRSRDYPAFFAQMDALLDEQPAALDQALAIAAVAPALLLCFEANPAICHRTPVAAAMARRAPAGLEVVHL